MSNEATNGKRRDEHCPECEFGSLKAGRATYMRWFAGQFVTVPNFPVWACDVCGYSEYDDQALEELEAFLGPGAELQQARGRAVRRAQGRTRGGARPGHRRPS